jgi:phosphopantothenoylcysteine decarboxylase
MPNVLLGVTGSVAALKTPLVYAKLKAAGHAVKVVATQAALYFFDPAALDPLDPQRPARNPAVVVLDEDEWPGRSAGRRYERDDAVLHIELRRWADLFLVAPLDANTLSKLAYGLCDNCLTCVWRAWDPGRPATLAPAMNTLMWDHPAAARALRLLAADAGAPPAPPAAGPDDLVAWINSHCPKLRVAPPEGRRLACGDVGVGAMAGAESLAALVDSMLAGGEPH